MRLPEPFYRKFTDTWYVQVGKKQTPLTIDGQRVRGNTAAAKARSKQAYKLLLRSQGLSQVETDSTTLYELIDVYLEWFKRNRSPISYNNLDKSILQPLRRSVAPTFLAKDLTYDLVDAAVRRETTRSPTTINRRIGYVTGMYNWAMLPGRKLVTTNPIKGMERPLSRSREAHIPPERFEEFMNMAQKKGQPFFDYVWVCLETGARPQEMRMFEAKHFNRADNRFEYTTKGRRVGEEDKRRIIQLTGQSLAIVTRLADEYPEGKLFRNNYGQPWTKGAITNRFDKLKDKFGMRELCATVLRHSFAHFRLTQTKQDPVVVATLMGHKDTRQLMATYGHLIDSQFMNDEASRGSPLAGITCG